MASHHDDVPTLVHKLYESLKFSPPAGQYTILAAFILTRGPDQCKVVSLATGTKCLPFNRLPTRGEALHDSHSEVLARRGLIRWLLGEIQRKTTDESYIEPSEASPGLWKLKSDVKLTLYITSLPCGDASTRHLASVQDPSMALLKSTPFPVSQPQTSPFPSLQLLRGRNDYASYGVLRSKPGRADSPPSHSMSCSDKIASWNYLGVQGALAGSLLENPLYIDNIVVGLGDEGAADGDERQMREDCERAFWRRLDGIEDCGKYSLHKPAISLTSVPFIHSKVSRTTDASKTIGSSNESLCWVAGHSDTTGEWDVAINGCKRGVSPKHRFRPKSRPMVSRASLFGLYAEIRPQLGSQRTSYHEVKQSNEDYQRAKTALVGASGPFRGWLRTGKEYQEFDYEGNPGNVVN